MNIAILTRRYGFNYGSSLQAYAMRKLFEEQGHNVSILNYDEFSSHPAWYIKPLVMNIISEIVLSCHVFFRKTSFFQKLKSRKEQIDVFSRFDSEYIRPTKKVLRSTKQLSQAIDGVDVCVCGSDQIWNPALYDVNYFLPFVCDGTIRMAFAPSFGVSDLSSRKEEIAAMLRNFDYISVREEAGNEILKNLIGKSCPVLLDPTMAVDVNVWYTIKGNISQTIGGKYVVCYFLGNKQIPYNFIDELSQSLNLTVVNITTFRTPNNIKGLQLENISPTDFLDVIKSADYVLTDSFHASVFSILFERNFYAFSKHKESALFSENSRLYTLLENFGLQERHVTNSFDKKNFSPIDFTTKNKKLSKYREKVDDYLNILKYC